MVSFFKGSANGTFSAAANTTLLAASGAVPILTAVDLDLDGALDLAAVNSTDGKAYVLLSTGAQAQAWKAPQSFTADTGAAGIAVGDFGKAGMGKDGKLDLAVSTNAATAGIGLLAGAHM